jgi:signal transduction histidine kinase
LLDGVGHAGEVGSLWPRLLRHRTVRMRLTAVYGVLFLLISLGLLAITNGLFATHSANARTVAANAAGSAGGQSELARAQAQIRQLRGQLASAEDAGQSDATHTLAVGSAIALGIMTVVSLALGWGVAGRVLRPLRVMTATTRRISADSLHERLAMPGPHDELKDLADTIDGLLERLDGSFTAQRRFAANAAHELRTPLATMRASLDVAVAKPAPVPATAVADRLYGELDRMDRLLDGLLTLARAEHGDLPGPAVLSLDAVASAALAARADAIRARNLTVARVDSPDGAWVTGSEELVCRMVGNVVDNAIAHNEADGWIKISTLTSGPAASLVVENGGPVLDPGQVRELARPFRRIGPDRTGSDGGSGLGLSIVAAIAAAHHGTLELRARPDGGLRVRIRLPAS